jgi:NitT/TauT family transport system substrate-binding protein
LLKKIIDAHNELTDWINKNPQEAQKLVHAELQALTGGKISIDLVRKSWNRLIFTSSVNEKSLQEFVDDAYKCKLLKKRVDITKLLYK